MVQAQEAKGVVLTGLDPVQLVAGKEVPGKPALFAEHGKFRYLFATEADKATFLSHPADYSVQNPDWCFFMPKMRALPYLHTVHEGRIFLAGSSSALRMAREIPDRAFKFGQFITGALAAGPTVGILVFPGCQSIDVHGPYDMVVGAHLNVVLVGESAGSISSNSGLTLTPDCTFETCPKLDALVVPGGYVLTREDEDAPLIAWLRARAKDTKHVLSVCNGAFLLALAGSLEGKSVTTTHGLLELLPRMAKTAKVVTDQRVVEDGNLISTGSGTAGIDGALLLLERLAGHGKAQETAAAEEYAWQPGTGYITGAVGARFLNKALMGGIALPPGANAETTEFSGGTHDWTKGWRITGTGLTREAILKACDARLSASWTKVNAGVDAGDSRGHWTFTDERGAAWDATASVTPSAENPSTFSLRLSIKKRS